MLINYFHHEGYVLVLLARLSVSLPSDYLKCIEWICVKFLLEVCLGPRYNRLDFGDDPDTIRIQIYDLYPIWIAWICMKIARTNPLNLGDSQCKFAVPD